MVNCVIGISHLLYLLLLLCGDVHPNPGPNCEYSDLSICHTNIRSLKGKDKMMHINCDLVNKYNVIALSETWLSENDASDNYLISGYQGPIRRDRDFGQLGYGGVLLWVSNNIACRRRKDLELPDIEALWVELRTFNKTVLLCVIYRAESNTDISFWDKLQENIDNILTLSNHKIMIIGDLNSDPNTRHGQLLKEFAEINLFTIHIKEPTRSTARSESILDQVITNFPMFIKETKVKPPLLLCDHNVISVKCLFRIKRQPTYQRTMWRFNLTNFDLFRLNLADNNWKNIFACTDVNSICNQFTTQLMHIAKASILNKDVTVRPNDKPWFNSYLRKLYRKRNQSFKVYKEKKTDLTLENYKEKQEFYHQEIIRIKTEYENVKYSILARTGNDNPKKWWKLLKNVYKDNETIETIPPIEYEDKCFTNDYDKANAFNDYFLSISAVDDENIQLPEYRRITQEGTLSSINITLQDVTDQIQILDISKSYGPDDISPRFLKEGIDVLSIILQRIFNLSLSSCIFPNIWKKANVMPIHKKGPKGDINNYRPISLLSVVGKVFERIVFKYVYNHFKENFIISIHQSGFLPNRSTITQLLEVYHHFCKAVDENKEIRVIFLDISKAFDKVWHKGILFKLQQCGIGGSLLKWFSDYLKDRMQRVVVNGRCGEWGKITAGVPQGSVLGPLLFIVYINDISQAVSHCNIRLFADDTCLFINVDNRVTTAIKIDEDLQSINQWSKQWIISFSPAKTKSLIISNKRDIHLHPPVHLDNIIVEEVKSHTYLGLQFSHDLKWKKHIDSVAIKARKRLSAMKPLKYKLDRKALQIMYSSFVLPLMEYGNVVWGGSFDCDFAKLEKINTDAMRLITGATAKSNISKLNAETAFLTIRERSEDAILVMLYKVKSSLSPKYLTDLLPPENSKVIQYSLRNNKDIKVPFTRLEVFKRSFFPAAIKLWNKLDVNIRSCQTLSLFKQSLKQRYPEPNILYFYGQRWASVHHSRMRMGCSKLNYDLCYKLYVTDDPACQCGAPMENAYHFFLECRNFNLIRRNLLASIEPYSECNINVILNGNNDLSKDNNFLIFDAVHKFIINSNRFI